MPYLCKLYPIISRMRKFLCILFLVSGCLAIAQTKDAEGRKQGYWKKKDERTNKLIYEGEFKDDKPVGRFKYYYPNDTAVRAIMHFKKGGESAYVKLFHQNGKRMAEGKYVGKEIKDSVWVYYDEAGGLLSREKYSMGKKNGPSTVYYRDGNVSEERNYKMDVQDGPFKQYFDENKAIKGQGLYVNGDLEGRTAYYYPNGVEVAAGYYKKGRKDGVWIYREENGKVKEKELFRNGRQASDKEAEAYFAKHKAPAEAIKTEAPKENKKTEPKQRTK